MPRYFSTAPLVTVCISSLWHSVHLPRSGILRNFAPHVVHRNVCEEYDRMFPIMSGRM